MVWTRLLGLVVVGLADVVALVRFVVPLPQRQPKPGAT